MTPDVESLIVDHLSLVHVAAGLVLRKRRLPPYVERGDLEAVGRFALVTVALRYRPDGDASFKTYAMPRLYGSMLDYLRDAAPLSRTAWKKFQAGDLSVVRRYLDIDHQPEIANELAVAATQDADVEFDDAFERSMLRRALRTLPAREEKVLLLYYRDGLTMQAISDRIGVNTSRVSQLHARALRRLRTVVTENPWAN